MRPNQSGCVRSRHVTSHRLSRISYRPLIWILAGIVFSGSHLDAQNKLGGYRPTAGIVAAAEAFDVPTNSKGVSSSTDHTIEPLGGSHARKSGWMRLLPFSTVPAVRAFLTPIRLHESTTAAAKLKGHENKQQTTTDKAARAADEQQMSLTQNDYEDRGNDAGGTARPAEEAYFHVVGGGLNTTPTSPGFPARKASPERLFTPQLLWTRSPSAIADKDDPLRQVRSTCSDCRDRAAALEDNRSYASDDDNLQQGKSVVLSDSGASLVTKSSSEDAELHQHVGQVVTAPALQVQLAYDATYEGKTRPQDGRQAEIPDPRAAGFPLRKHISSAATFAGSEVAVNAAWIEIPSDTGEPSDAEGGTSHPASRRQRINVRRTPRPGRLPQRSSAANEPDTAEADVVQSNTATDESEPQSDQSAGPTVAPPVATGTAEPNLDNSDTPTPTSESPLGQTTSSTEAPAPSTPEHFLPPPTSGSSEQRSSVGAAEAGMTASADDFAAAGGASLEGLPTGEPSDEKSEAGAPFPTDVSNTSDTGEEGATTSTSPFSEGSPDSGHNTSEFALEAATPADTLAGHVQRRSEEALTTRNDVIQHTKESDLSDLGPRLPGGSTQRSDASAGEAAKPEDGGATKGQAQKEEKQTEDGGATEGQAQKEKKQTEDGGATEGQAQKEKKQTDIESIYKNAVSTSPATNYLGAGYDPVKGNPAGDPVLMGDPGLRAPVIQLKYEQTAGGISNDLTMLQPLNGFVRPYIACRQSESVVEIHSLRDYQKELSADAALNGGDIIGANSFSASAGYKEMAKEMSSKTRKTFMLKRYCIRFEAGLAQSSNVAWALTSGFAAAVAELPTEFDGKNPGCACTADQWRQDHRVPICRSTNIPVWFNFIEQFGTHYVTHLYAGGKMTYQVSMDAAEARKAKKKGVNLEAQIKIQLGMGGGAGRTKHKFDSDSESKKSELNMETELLIIGGRPPPDLKDPNALASWVETVDSLPMPVKMEVQSLKHLLPPEKQEAFLDAAVYYGKAVGMSLQDLNVLTGEVNTFSELLRESTQIAWAGPPPGFAKCPPGKVIIYGFAMHLSFADKALDSYHITACSPDREKCDGVGVSTSNYDDERIYATCGDNSINEVQQVVVESDLGANQRGIILTASCPEDTIIVAGFGFSYGAGRLGIDAFHIEACKAGQTVCTKAPSPGSTKSFIWIVCIDKQFPGARNVKNVVGLGTVGKANKYAPENDGQVEVRCPANSKVVQGFVMEAHTNFQQVRDRFTHCKAGIEKCTMSGKGVENGGLLRTDRHALCGWCVCDDGPELGSHVASDSQRKARIRMQKAMKKDKSTSPDALLAQTDVDPHEKPSDNRPPQPTVPRPGRRRRRPPPSTTTTTGISPIQSGSPPVDEGASAGETVTGGKPTSIQRTAGNIEPFREAVEPAQSEL